MQFLFLFFYFGLKNKKKKKGKSYIRVYTIKISNLASRLKAFKLELEDQHLVLIYMLTI